jgi:hypothetical protein
MAVCDSIEGHNVEYSCARGHTLSEDAAYVQPELVELYI